MNILIIFENFLLSKFQLSPISWIYQVKTHSQFLLPGIGTERLGFQDEFPSWTKVAIYFLEKPLDPNVPPVEVDPLAKAQS